MSDSDDPVIEPFRSRENIVNYRESNRYIN